MTDAPAPALLEAALEATWPAAAARCCGTLVLRDGAGGGRRASAATARAPVPEGDPEAAIAAMRAAGAEVLFRLRPDACAWDGPLDAALHARGLLRADPTLIMAAPVAVLAPAPLPHLRAFTVWPPLAIQREIWAEGGIGPARLAVMARVDGPRTGLMARIADRVAGTAFVAVAGPVAMLHAVEVTHTLRRRGAARALTQAAADWARAQGATWLALAVTEGNAPARELYDGLGMAVAHRYHYRVLP